MPLACSSNALSLSYTLVVLCLHDNALPVFRCSVGKLHLLSRCYGAKENVQIQKYTKTSLQEGCPKRKKKKRKRTMDWFYFGTLEYLIVRDCRRLLPVAEWLA